MVCKNIRSNNIFETQFQKAVTINFFHLILKSSRPEVFYKNGVLKSLAKFTEKHLC